MDKLIADIKEYLRIINDDIETIDEDLIDFVIGEVLDRVQLYLNSDQIPSKLERIIANIVNTGLKKAINNKSVEDTDKAISSISDNGQSISYTNEVTKYFTTASDEELFGGFTALLSRYRRIKVVHPKKNEE